MMNMKNVADDVNFSKKKFQVEISTPVEYSTGKPKIIEKKDFWTQISFL